MTNIINLKLELRKCKACENTFKVLARSKQEYHSEICQMYAEGLEEVDLKRLKALTREELYYIKTGKRVGHLTLIDFDIENVIPIRRFKRSSY